VRGGCPAVARAIPALRPLLGRQVEITALESTALTTSARRLSVDELLASRIKLPPGVGPLSTTWSGPSPTGRSASRVRVMTIVSVAVAAIGSYPARSERVFLRLSSCLSGQAAKDLAVAGYPAAARSFGPSDLRMTTTKAIALWNSF
jgi:hypothetical protein